METGKITKPASKRGRYFKYAIGEIILVVIGILIALQVNNWNVNQKSKRLAETYIKDIRQDLISDTIMFNTALQRAHQTIAKNKAILNIRNSYSISSDSLYRILNVFHSMRIYQINNASYSKLLNTGVLESNSYKALFSSINTYYTKEYNTYSEYIEWDEQQGIDIVHNDFLGDYKNHIDISSLLVEHKDHFNSEALGASIRAIREFIVSSQFRNKVLSNYIRKEKVVERILIQKQLASELLTEINKALKNNDYVKP